MAKSPSSNDDLRPEYDESSLKGGVRGKYAERYDADTNLVRLAPDVAVVFCDDDAVNEALRLIMRVADDAGRITKRSGGGA